MVPVCLINTPPLPPFFVFVFVDSLALELHLAACIIDVLMYSFSFSIVVVVVVVCVNNHRRNQLSYPPIPSIEYNTLLETYAGVASQIWCNVRAGRCRRRA